MKKARTRHPECKSRLRGSGVARHAGREDGPPGDLRAVAVAEAQFRARRGCVVVPVEGQQVHAGQLRNLLRIGRNLRTVGVQVMPMDRKEQLSMDGPFNLLTVRKQLPYMEVHSHSRPITDAEEVRILTERSGFSGRPPPTRQALRPSESLLLIEKLRGRLRKPKQSLGSRAAIAAAGAASVSKAPTPGASRRTATAKAVSA
ncbi:Scr1 family TA system antitoxin-like transcriptional regulator [Streptomyces sp. NPDC002787]